MDTQETNTQNMGAPNTPNTEIPSMMGAPIKKSSPIGPVIGLILILAIIIVGSLYFWEQRTLNTVAPATQTDETSQTPYTSTLNLSGDATNSSTPDAQTQSLQTQSSSVDTGSIESDLNATDFQNIDSGADQLQ